MANGHPKAASGRTKCTVLLEVVADVVKRRYPPEQMRIVQEGFEKEDLLAAA
jgi:hypothetical protein